MLTSFWFVSVSFISLIFIFAVPGGLPQPLGIHFAWFCFLFIRVCACDFTCTQHEMHTKQYEYF